MPLNNFILYKDFFFFTELFQQEVIILTEVVYLLQKNEG